MYKIFKITGILALLAIVGTTSSMNRQNFKNRFRTVFTGMADAIREDHAVGYPVLFAGMGSIEILMKRTNATFDLGSIIKNAIPLSLIAFSGSFIKHSLPNYEDYNCLLRTLLDQPIISILCASTAYRLLKHGNLENPMQRNFATAICFGTTLYLTAQLANNYLSDILSKETTNYYRNLNNNLKRIHE